MGIPDAYMPRFAAVPLKKDRYEPSQSFLGNEVTHYQIALFRREFQPFGELRRPC